MKLLELEENIKYRLMNIIKNRLEINLDNAKEELLNKDFLGSHFRLEPRDMLYLYFDIENEFNILIPQEDIAKGTFNNFNNIAKIISNQIMNRSDSRECAATN